VHAVDLTVQEVGKIERAALLDVGQGGGLHRGGDFFFRKIDAGKRHGCDHIDLALRRGDDHRHGVDDGGCRLNIDRFGVSHEAGLRNLQPVSAEGKV